MDRGVWQATVLGVIRICTQLKRLSMHTHTQSLSILYSCCHCWCCKIDTTAESETLGTEKRKTEKKKNENLLSLNAKNSLSHSWSRTTWCLLELSAQVCGCQRKSGNCTADLVVLLRLVCFPDLSATIYFRVLKYLNHSFSMGFIAVFVMRPRAVVITSSTQHKICFQTSKESKFESHIK